MEQKMKRSFLKNYRKKIFSIFTQIPQHLLTILGLKDFFLSDDLEFYKRGGLFKDFQQQRKALREQDDIWNSKRTHQALGYLSPMRFYQLWKEDPKEAYQIVEKWQDYLRRQRIGEAQSRRIKKREQIEALMNFIDAKLNKNKGLKEVKLQLINCELCSVT